MASSRFTITCLSAIASAPRDRHTETIIGSISGVSPTATASAKTSAPAQSPLARPLVTNTTGTITSTMPIISQVNRARPTSNAVGACGAATAPESPPSSVSRPVATTTASAVPLATLVPSQATESSSRGGRPGVVSARANFSTGNDSPVSAACDTNRSLAATSLTSAGTMSPAARWIMSPGTSRSTGNSTGPPSRTTVACSRSSADSAAAASSARASCTNRRPAPMPSITSIIPADTSSPVATATAASIASSTTSGFTAARRRIRRRDGRSRVATTLGPCRARRLSASAVVRPARVAARSASTVSVAAAAAAATRGQTWMAASPAGRSAGCRSRRGREKKSWPCGRRPPGIVGEWGIVGNNALGMPTSTCRILRVVAAGPASRSWGRARS